MPELPRGRVTLLFTDIEGSTRLLQALGDLYPAVLADHRRLLRQAFSDHRGVEVDTQGDGFFVAFAHATDGARAACAAQRALATYAWPAGSRVRVRMGLHTGEPTLAMNSYIGLDVHHGARLCAAGHGGQVLVSHTTHALVEHDLPDGVGWRSLGEHRLKDLQRPEEIFELLIAGLAQDFPPLRTLRARPNNLPGQPTPLVGRERELAAAQQRLLHPDVRLLTLTGPGGTGKTRLGLQLAAEVLEHFSDGVCFVPLAAISDPALVPSAIAQALGVLETGGRPLLETLKDYLKDRELLLCLDNFEQLMPAASLMGELLAACPRVKVLVTSRAVLRVYGEFDFAVPPLELPSRAPLPRVEDLTQFEAVRLFVERAQAVKSDFSVTASSASAVAEICHRLDGLPLGIELAAARVRLLPPETMLVRMDRSLPLLTGGPRDRPSRHQTLRSAIGWSYDLLDESEQTLFWRLPAFAGGCTLEAAEAICGGWETGIPTEAPRGLESPTPDQRLLAPIDVLNGVESLLEQSLLRQEGDRLLMLETIREYGLERLEASGEAAEVRRRHAMYFLELAETAEPRLYGPEQVTWLDRLEAEHDNIRAVLAWSLTDASRAEVGLRLSGALLWFWLVRGYFGEGRRNLEAGLASGGDVALAVRVKALIAAGHLAQYEHDLEHSASLLQEGMTLGRLLGDDFAAARALSLLGETARIQGDHARATQLLEQSLGLQRQLGDRWSSYHTLYRLGETARDQGDYERAMRLHEESLALRRAAGDTRAIAAALHSLGLLALSHEDYARAASTLQQGLATHRQTRNRFGIAICLEGLAGIALAREQPVVAARLLGAVEALVDNMGVPFFSSERARYERDQAAARAQLDARTFNEARATGRAWTLDEAIAAALDEPLA